LTGKHRIADKEFCFLEAAAPNCDMMWGASAEPNYMNMASVAFVVSEIIDCNNKCTVIYMHLHRK